MEDASQDDSERSRPRVLVVDDSASVRELITINLELSGFEVVTARDGQECLDVIAEVRPDVLTVDVVMPRLDGFSTVERLRADPATAGLPIAMVTAAAQRADLARGRALGVDAYVTKPFEPEELVATVWRLATSRDPA